VTAEPTGTTPVSPAPEPPDGGVERAPGRSWAQRLTIGAAIVGAFACFASAAVLATGRWALSQRQLVVIDAGPAADQPAGVTQSDVADDGVATNEEAVDAGPIRVEEVDPIEPDAGLAEPEASNFLLAGTDNNACIDPNSPYAPFLLGRENFGERADVVMVWRVNPETGQVAALSLQRDLYVRIDGGRRGRINAAFDASDPNKLINTVRDNFGIPIDHYIQVDFCAFKKVVDSVDGVGVPFAQRVRDRATGLEIDTTGCVNLDGDAALAYVRSRKLQYERPVDSGNWILDPTSDYGRVARQQDFIRRTIDKAVSNALYRPDVAQALISANAEYVITDSDLTVSTLLAFGNALRGVDTSSIGSYQVTSTGRNVGGQSVLIPQLDNSEMQAILALFRGDTTLDSSPVSLDDVDAPPLEAEPGPTTPGEPTPEPAIVGGPAGESGLLQLLLPILLEQASPAQADPPADNTIGWVPDPLVTCD
jgi:LCP family protein required for cell wall assembly